MTACDKMADARSEKTRILEQIDDAKEASNNI